MTIARLLLPPCAAVNCYATAPMASTLRLLLPPCLAASAIYLGLCKALTGYWLPLGGFGLAIVLTTIVILLLIFRE